MAKIEINNETNELNYLFGGYFSGCGRVKIRKIKQDVSSVSYDLSICVSFDNMKFAKLFKENFGGYITKQPIIPRTSTNKIHQSILHPQISFYWEDCFD